MWNQSEIERLHDAIYHRKSVRKFKPESLPSETLNAIMQKTEELTALDPKAKVTFRILGGNQIIRFLSVDITVSKQNSTMFSICSSL